MSDVIFDQFCMEHNCEHVILWDHDVELNGYESTVECISCIPVGQSYNIEQYPDSCPFLKEIKEWEEEQLALKTWHEVAS